MRSFRNRVPQKKTMWFMRIRDGQSVLVDGFRGEVSLDPQE
jgi:hypothetical protein